MSILILCKKFPFGNGESFLESELRVAAEVTEKIVIIPCESFKKESLTNRVPPPLKVYKIPCLSGKLRKLYYFLYGFSNWSHPMLKSELQRTKKLVKRIFAIYVWGKANCFANHIENELQKKREPHPDIIYSYWLFDLALAAVLLKEKWGAAKIKTVSRGHGYDLYCERNKLEYLPFQEQLVTKLDHIYPCSRDGETYLRVRYPEQSFKIQCSYLGTLAKDIPIALPCGNQSKHSINIITCSNLIPLKRVMIVAKALHLLEAKYDKIEWFCIGAGPEQKNLKKYAIKNFDKIHVHFLGQIDNSALLTLYEKTFFDVFINVSKSEGLPVSIMEAMSYGIPTIATDVGGTPEIVEDGKNGFLLQKQIDENILAKMLDTFFHLPKTQILELRINSRKKWESCFNAQENFFRYYEALKRLQDEDKNCAT